MKSEYLLDSSSSESKPKLTFSVSSDLPLNLPKKIRELFPEKQIFLDSAWMAIFRSSDSEISSAIRRSRAINYPPKKACAKITKN